MSSLTETTPELAADALPRGVTPPSGAGGRFLSDVIVGLGFADREAVDQALDGSRAPGKKLGTTLVEMGALSERQLGRAVAERYRLDFLDLSEFDIDPEAVHVIGDAEMRRYDAVPVAFTEDGALVVAMIDPADWLAAEEMAQLTGRRIRRAVAAPSEVIELIARVAEARSGGDGTGGRDSGAETSSTMPSRLTLRPVTRPLVGRALGSEFGLERPLSAGATPQERPPQLPAQAPAERAATDRVAVQAAADAMERRLTPVPSPTADVDAAPDGQTAVEAPAGGLDADPANEVGREQVPSALELSNDDREAAEGEPDALPWAPDESGSEEAPDEARQPAPETPAEEAPSILAFNLASAEPESAQPEAAPAPAEAASAPTQTASGPSPDWPVPPKVAQPAAEQPQTEGDARAGSEEFEHVHAQLAGTRGDLEETNDALGRVRDELEATRTELVGARSRHDGVLERSAETERLLAESRAQVGRLEAELAAAHDQSRSLREDLTWARGQIEQRGEREGEALAELRSHIESMKGLRPVDPPPPDAPSVPAAEPPESVPAAEQPPEAPPATEPPAPPPAPLKIAAPSTNGASAPEGDTAPSPVAGSGARDHARPVTPPKALGGTGTTKARGLKRLIAAVRRL